MKNEYFLEIDNHGFYNLYVNNGTWPIASTNFLLKKQLDFSNDTSFIKKMKPGKQVKVNIEEIETSVLIINKA